MILPVRTEGISDMIEEKTIHKSVSASCFQ